jgi:peptidoglycan-associated lipoprotein
MNWRTGILWMAVSLVAMLATACGPEYPKCDNDDDCASSEKGKEEGKLFCVNGLCQQCAEDADCGDASLECNAGVCEQIPGYCTSVDDCPGNQKCRNNRCGAECVDDSECTDGKKCQAGSCVEPAECSIDSDCPSGKECDAGKCVDPPACSLETVYFSYDSSTIDDSARSGLQANADCIKERDLTVRIEGHADERGTSEYNIALGERRARNAAKYLHTLGVPKKSTSTISYGEERLASECGEQGPESCHRRNRRVVFSER